MAKPYLLFKMPSGIWYARIQLPDGTHSNNRSTGCRDRNAAERVVMEWIVNNKLPSRINSADDKRVGLDKITVLNSLRTLDLEREDIQNIIKILKERNLIHSAVMMASPESKPIDKYIKEFWAFETSPYVKEKKLKGGSIHRDYCEAMLMRATKYWLPSVAGKPVGCITHDDVTALFENEEVLKLAPKTINSVVSSVTIPLKWAFFHNLTEINCFDGIMKCSQKSKKREILTMEQAAAVFASDWDNDTAKLANAVAFYTGMRAGEIAALRFEDIGVDRLYVRHSWRNSEGLKECKNGEEREVLIPPQIRDMLIAEAKANPWGQKMKGFVFWGLTPDHPTDPKNWLKFLRRVLENIGYSDPDKITFHAWRHLWCSRMSDEIADKRVLMTSSGHKTEAMLDHYAAHMEQEKALEKLRSTEERLLLPILGFDKEESKIQDIEAKIISENEKKKDDNNTNKEDCE